MRRVMFALITVLCLATAVVAQEEGEAAAAEPAPEAAPEAASEPMASSEGERQAGAQPEAEAEGAGDTTSESDGGDGAASEETSGGEGDDTAAGLGAGNVSPGGAPDVAPGGLTGPQPKPLDKAATRESLTKQACPEVGQCTEMLDQRQNDLVRDRSLDGDGSPPLAPDAAQKGGCLPTSLLMNMKMRGHDPGLSAAELYQSMGGGIGNERGIGQGGADWKNAATYLNTGGLPPGARMEKLPETEDAIKESLKDGPVAVHFQADQYNWAAAEMKYPLLSEEENKKQGVYAHAVNVLGYDKENDQYKIADTGAGRVITMGGTDFNRMWRDRKIAYTIKGLDGKQP